MTLSEKIYRLRYIIAGVRLLWPGGDWTFIEAWRSVAGDFDGGEAWAWQADGYSPAEAARESMSYWPDGA